MKKEAILFGLCLFILGCNSKSKKPVFKEQVNIAELFDGYFKEYLTYNPNVATSLG